MADKLQNGNGQLSFFAEKSNNNQEANINEYENDEQYDSEPNTYSELDVTNVAGSNVYSLDYDTDDQINSDAEIAPEHTVRPQRVSTSGLSSAKAVKKKKSGGFFIFDIKNSLIINFFVMISSVIGKAFRNSFTVYIFTSFDRLREKFSESFIFSTLTTPKAERVAKDTKKRFRRAASEAVIPSAFSGFFTSLIRIRTRVYGYVLFAFGITVLAAHFFVVGLVPFFSSNVYNPITAIIVLFSAIFLISCNKTLSETMKESAILSLLLFNFLGITRPSFADENEIYFPASGAFVIGFLLGAFTLFYPAHAILAVIFTAIYTFIVVRFPETGVISLIILTPFVYDTALLYISVLITLSYVFKILTGKRTANFEFSDIFIAFFLLLMLLSEIISFGSSEPSFMYTVFILAYFMCVLAMKESVWFERATNAFVLTTCLFSAYSLFVALLGRTLSLDIEFITNSDLGSPDKTVIASTGVLSLFVMCGIIFLLTAFIESKQVSKKFVYMLLIIVSLVYLFLEASPTIIIALIISVIIYLVIISNKTVIFIAAAAVIIPLISLFNSGVYSIISDVIEKEAYRVNIYSAVVNMLSTYGFTGIGMVRDAFPELYSTYYVGNTVMVPHAHSLLFQLAISLGLPGLILFIIILFFSFQGAFSYGRNTTDKHSKNRLYCYAGMCTVLALIICGMTEYIAYNPRVFLVIWLMLGLTVCARRSARDASSSLGFIMEYDENYNG